MEIDFKPLKPFKKTINVIIKKPSTGAWIYQLELVATYPNIDDIIQI